MNELNRLLTRSEVCKLLDVSKPTLDIFRRSGRLPEIRLSPRAIRFRREDVEAFIAASSTSAA
jgi:excisionase family DNA binding protein